MIVLDASVVLVLLLDLEPSVASVRERVGREREWAAPHLLDAEVGQVLRRFVQRGEVSPERAAQALQDLLDLPIQRYAHTRLLARTFELRSNVTFYDGLYLALAEALNGELLTADRALAAVPNVEAVVSVV